MGRLDIKGDNVVKGVQMDGLRVIAPVLELAREYYAQGIDELVVIDVVASLYGRNSVAEIIRAVTSDCFVPVTVGGGIRSLEDADRLFRAGADKVAVNTAAMFDPSLIRAIASKYGSQAIVVSVQAKRSSEFGWECYIESGRERTGRAVESWITEAESHGAGEFLLTSVDQDGTQNGMDLPLAEMVSSVATIPTIASGGVKDAGDAARTLLQTACAGVAIGSAFHYRASTPDRFREQCRDAGVPVRELER